MAGIRSLRLAAAAAAAALASAASASNLPSFAVGLGSWVQKERDVPTHSPETSSWTRLDRVKGDERLTVSVVLRVDAERIAELERVLYEVSDPDHENYGHHLTQEEVTALLAVPKERAEQAGAYFTAAGADEVVPAPNGDMLTVTISAAAAEVALNTRFHTFQHSEHMSAKIVRASEGYFLPAKIAEHVAMVGELLQFPRLPSKTLHNLTGAGGWPNSCDASGCSGLVTPGVLAERYKLPDQASNESDVAAANSMSVAEFQGQFYKDADLQTFSKSCHRSVKVDKVIGEERQQGGVESELDIEYIKAVAPEIPLTVIYNGEYSLLSWANQINSLTNPPLVHSVSYGNDEAQQTSTEYMLTCNTAFMKAGVKGLSILFASGDQGVCGREGCGFLSKRFKPDFPAASPYITAVGGTNFEGSSIGPESAWNNGGGGFSDTFPVPAYQAAAVAAYKASPDAKLPPQKMWNATGRGYPDVAALGGEKTPYCVEVGGVFQGVAGTSASSPVVAGVFAKLNGLRLKKGKQPLGFLNPFIYKNPSGFQDVQSGVNNAGTRYGFAAIKGWDAATGFGTPDFEALSKLVVRFAGDAREETTIVV